MSTGYREVVVYFSFIRKEGHKIAMVKALRRADPHSDNYNAMDLYTGLENGFYQRISDNTPEDTS